MGRVNWSRVDRLINMGQDITELLLTNTPAIADHLQPVIIPNGIEMDRFTAAGGDRRSLAWVGHPEP
jgi:hypothetical protein